MFRYSVSVILLLLSSKGAWAQNPDNNNILNNKIFVREVSSVCKSFKDKGCLITTFEALNFKTDSMFVYYYTVNDCETDQLHYEKDKKVKAYSYQIQKKRNSPNYIIRTNGFAINSLEVTPTQLVEFINDPSLQSKERITFDIKKEIK